MTPNSNKVILAGDVGGTQTRLAILNIKEGRFNIIAEQQLASREEESLESILHQFLSVHGYPVTHACLGVAGPVLSGRCETTNLPWIIDSREIARRLNLPKVELMNDLEANAFGIEVLEEKDFEILNAGTPDPRGNRAVISAGTGLGEAGIFWDGNQFRPFASEGGHSDFAPRNPVEMDLLDFLLKQHGRVSVERVLSGQGIVTIYQFLRKKKGAAEPKWLSDQMRQFDPPAVITRNALEEKNPLCMEAIDFFVSLYGAEAGNLALKFMATGGVYLGGGIAPKIIDKLRGSSFKTAFTAKGRMKPLLRNIPVRVIMNPNAALLGAAYHAVRQ